MLRLGQRDPGLSGGELARDRLPGIRRRRPTPSGRFLRVGGGDFAFEVSRRGRAALPVAIGFRRSNRSRSSFSSSRRSPTAELGALLLGQREGELRLVLVVAFEDRQEARRPSRRRPRRPGSARPGCRAGRRRRSGPRPAPAAPGRGPPSGRPLDVNAAGLARRRPRAATRASSRAGPRPPRRSSEAGPVPSGTAVVGSELRSRSGSLKARGSRRGGTVRNKGRHAA